MIRVILVRMGDNIFESYVDIFSHFANIEPAYCSPLLLAILFFCQTHEMSFFIIFLCGLVPIGALRL